MQLKGKRIAILVAEGVEDLEFFVPLMRLQEEGAEVIAAGLDLKSVRGKNGRPHELIRCAVMICSRSLFPADGRQTSCGVTPLSRLSFARWMRPAKSSESSVTAASSRYRRESFRDGGLPDHLASRTTS
jgi:putative intracellular protease/amidase